MKKFLMSAAAMAALLAGPAMAEEASGPWTVTGSVALTTNYTFRGITQSGYDPAIQAGVTLGHESGFYVGFWGSNIDFGTDAELETDFFAGYGGALGENTTFDVNVTYYTYPGSPSALNYDYFELIAGVTHDFGFAKVNVKGAYSPDFFGSVGNAYWLGGNLSIPVGSFVTLSGNIGEQWFDDNVAAATPDYFHYDLGVTFTYENASLDLRYVDTDITGLKDSYVATLSFAF